MHQVEPVDQVAVVELVAALAKAETAPKVTVQMAVTVPVALVDWPDQLDLTDLRSAGSRWM